MSPDEVQEHARAVFAERRPELLELFERFPLLNVIEPAAITALLVLGVQTGVELVVRASR